MDSSVPGSTNSLVTTSLTPVFADNVQDMLGTGTINVNPSTIITVNSIADVVDDFNSGVTTLRDAINQANADSGKDLIVFDRSLFASAQTISLNLGELDITHDLNIVAPRDTLTGGDLVTVSGNNASRVFEIESGATVGLNGLIIADGNVMGDNGGGIKNSSILTLDNSIVRNDSVKNIYGRGTGGGIFNNGTLNLSNSTISGNSVSNGGSGGGIYNISGSVKVSNSTISENKATNVGGGIYNANNGNFEVNNSSISDNSTSYEGGGIFNFGILGVSDSIISGNSTSIGAINQDGGGGISNRTGIVTISNSIINGNSSNSDGGGISNSYAGKLTISNSSISDNEGRKGGGINSIGGSYNGNTGFLEVSNSIINGNKAQYGGGINTSETTNLTDSIINGNSAPDGAGIFIDINGITTVNNSTISNNIGNGLWNDGGMTTVNNSTISGNSTNDRGGGIVNALGITEVNNSTISGNSASYEGGGIDIIGGTVNLTNSTISENKATNAGGGIYNSGYGTLTLLFSTVTGNLAANGGGLSNRSAFLGAASNSVRNTIIAANLNSADGINPDVSGAFTSSGYNLIGDSTGSTGFDATGDIVGTSDNPLDPRLAPLDLNGGPTQTVALLPDSPAIDAGDLTVLDTDPTTDQRGFPRAINGRADIGAFEFSS